MAQIPFLIFFFFLRFFLLVFKSIIQKNVRAAVIPL